jgi:hypothetical protein
MLALSTHSSVVDLQQLHQWLQSHSPFLSQNLQEMGINARDIILPFLLDPRVRHARQLWRNDRPVLQDEEILLVLLLLTRKKKVVEIDRTAYVTAIGILMIMAAPDPWPSRVRIDFQQRQLLFPK